MYARMISNTSLTKLHKCASDMKDGVRLKRLEVNVISNFIYLLFFLLKQTHVD